MPHHELPLLLSRVVTLWRHAFHFHHSVARMIEMVGYYIQTSPRIFRRGSLTSGSFRNASNRREVSTGHPKRPLLIHYHIFKNAGTSFEWSLAQSMGIGFRKLDSPIRGGIVSARDIARFAADNPDAKAISSHQAILFAPKVRGCEVFTSILIRDPIARIGSIYAFERRQEVSTPGALKAKELDFKRYVEWRLSATPAMLCNYQVYFCGRTKEQGSNWVPTALTLERAIANLDQVDAVGTVERYEEWLALARSILSKPFPGISLCSSRRNVSASEQETSNAAILDGLIGGLGQTMAERLLEGNQLDMCLHQVADALLTRRLAERGVEIALLEAYASLQKERWPTSVDVSSVVK
jgi:hypothetical protein